MEVGDRVIIKWTEKEKKHDFYCGIGPDGSRMDGMEGIIVALPESHSESPDVKCEGFPAFYIPIHCLSFLNDSDIVPPAINIKDRNSAPEATHCCNCNGLLKEPYPKIKYCPKCE